MSKKEAGPAGFERLVLSTVEFKMDLDKTMGQRYPFKAGSAEIRNCPGNFSFAVSSQENCRAALMNLIPKKLREKRNLMSDREHWAEHGVGREILELFLVEAEKGNFSLKKVKKRDKSGFIYEHFVFEIKVDRDVFVPEHYEQAEKIKKKYFLNKDGQKKEIRSLARKEGAADAVVVAIYLGLDRDDICQLFEDTNLRTCLGQAAYPIKQKKQDRLLLEALADKLLSRGLKPKRTKQAYEEAIELMQKHSERWAKSVSGKFVLLGKKTAIARMVLRGMTKQAIDQAEEQLPTWQDPDRTQYINEKYKGICSSDLITAYYRFKR